MAFKLPFKLPFGKGGRGGVPPTHGSTTIMEDAVSAPARSRSPIPLLGQFSLDLVEFHPNGSLRHPGLGFLDR